MDLIDLRSGAILITLLHTNTSNRIRLESIETTVVAVAVRISDSDDSYISQLTSVLTSALPVRSNVYLTLVNFSLL